VLQNRIPGFAERLWNNKAKSDYAEFIIRSEHAKNLYKRLFRPIEVIGKQLLQAEDLTFENTADISLVNNSKGFIKYVQPREYDLPDMNNGSLYKGPFTIDKSIIITAQVFTKHGESIGFPVQKHFQKVEPAYRYRILGPSPNKGWNEMPDFTRLEVIREGISGKMTLDRMKIINGELFTKVKEEGLIETRFQGIYNQYAV
jgi:hexosaminidase